MADSQLQLDLPNTVALHRLGADSEQAGRVADEWLHLLSNDSAVRLRPKPSRRRIDDRRRVPRGGRRSDDAAASIVA